eukprot:CAMPEP_0202854998 /NCGR_PEP_ID=MMETSP1389-20130828/91291_1 /ASSEMBLY_ACC=CAM_ASM_000865 /TAXON_ID=302021 /ORGANISM="Rhodomonas sp., Strain CCMP768" /LENGTH=276 /DNA_ID=CAMNT_0049533607 /DNA_START=1 /DNA_END=833 /DNA_ORIENTATION=-
MLPLSGGVFVGCMAAAHHWVEAAAEDAPPSRPLRLQHQLRPRRPAAHRPPDVPGAAADGDASGTVGRVSGMGEDQLTWGHVCVRDAFAGSVVAGASDLKIDLFGYACTTVANVFTVAYTLYMKELSSACGKMQVADIIFFNAFYSIPLLAMAAMVSGELEAAYAYPHLSSAVFQVSLVAASVMGILYQGAMVLANTKTSPLATSIAGNVKDIACTVVGYILFDSGPPTPTNLAGLSMSMGGAFWYMALKTNLLADDDSSWRSQALAEKARRLNLHL